MRPVDLAVWYQRGVQKGDTAGQWFFAQGENAPWCAAFVLQVCRESGFWLEETVAQRGSLRNVALLVEKSKTIDKLDSQNKKEELAYVVARDGEKHGHIGLVKSFIDEDKTFVGIEGNYRNKISTVQRSLKEVTAWIVLKERTPV